jgi:hypothetical protein
MSKTIPDMIMKGCARMSEIDKSLESWQASLVEVMRQLEPEQLPVLDAVKERVHHLLMDSEVTDVLGYAVVITTLLRSYIAAMHDAALGHAATLTGDGLGVIHD